MLQQGSGRVQPELKQTGEEQLRPPVPGLTLKFSSFTQPHRTLSAVTESESKEADLIQVQVREDQVKDGRRLGGSLKSRHDGAEQLDAPSLEEDSNLQQDAHLDTLV